METTAGLSVSSASNPQEYVRVVTSPQVVSVTEGTPDLIGSVLNEYEPNARSVTGLFVLIPSITRYGYGLLVKKKPAERL